MTRWTILRICAAAMEPGARLLIVEQVLPSGGARNVVPAVMDINMLVMLGGQERTGDEYETLLETSGFTGTVVKSTSGMWSVVEATRRDVANAGGTDRRVRAIRR